MYHTFIFYFQRPVKTINLGDITKVDPSKMKDFDLFVYSPPCQSWSTAGKQEGFADPRGTLFFNSLQIIQVKKPKYAIMENVKNLASKKFRFEFETMIQLLEQEGYKNYVIVLNSRDYGIPHNRERVFIVSIREDIEQDFKFPDQVPLRFELKDALEEDAELPILHNIYGGFGEVKARIFTDYSPTIRTSAGGGHIPSVVVKGFSLRTANELPKGYKLVDDYIIRQMSPLETWRLMGFDDEDFYKVKNGLNETFYKGRDRSDSQLYKLAGNSIVVDTLEHIFRELFKETKYIKDKNKIALKL